MPVTTRPSPFKVGLHQGRLIHATDDNFSRRVFDLVTKDCHSPYESDPRRPGYKPTTKPRDRMIWGGGRRYHFENLPLIASSFDGTSKGGTPTQDTAAVAPYANGFVDGLIKAFNQDLHLIIRPDDVWQAILSQFSLFINGNAERLRHLFVEHEGKRTLTVDLTPMDLADIDFGAVAQEFVSTIQANVVDAELKEWMLPAFSTTTVHDRAVAAFGTMGALQQYFDYEVLLGCGLPSVTLLGERVDWVELATRIERLPRYGDECARWADLLRPVVRHFVLTFDAPNAPEVHDFWLRVAHEEGSEGSGMGIRTLSGWITAFTYFEEGGQVTRHFSDEGIEEWLGQWRGIRQPTVDRKQLVLDGVKFPLIRPANIPKSVIVLPMTIQDLKARVKQFTTVISGSIGMSISASASTAQPVSAWWIVREFQVPIDSPSLSMTGSSVAGSTTEGPSDSSSALGTGLDDYGREDVDSDFDDLALP